MLCLNTNLFPHHNHLYGIAFDIFPALGSGLLIIRSKNSFVKVKIYRIEEEMVRVCILMCIGVYVCSSCFLPSSEIFMVFFFLPVFYSGIVFRGHDFLIVSKKDIAISLPPPKKKKKLCFVYFIILFASRGVSRVFILSCRWCYSSIFAG